MKGKRIRCLDVWSKKLVCHFRLVKLKEKNLQNLHLFILKRFSASNAVHYRFNSMLLI